MLLRLRQALWTRRIWWVLLPGALMFVSPYVVLLLDQFFRLTGGNNLPPLPGALLAGPVARHGSPQV